MSTYRTGTHWGVTIVREADSGRREDNELVAVVTNGDTGLAERICNLLNGNERRQGRARRGRELPGDGLLAPREEPGQ